MDTCALCQKHKGQGEFANPPGGYIYEDEHFLVCHAPVNKGPLGTLFIESVRHVLDFSEFTLEEAANFGKLAGKIYTALRKLTGAERIYQISIMEAIPHFHAWILPRRPEIKERGTAFLALDLSCNEDEAVDLAERLRKALQEDPEFN